MRSCQLMSILEPVLSILDFLGGFIMQCCGAMSSGANSNLRTARKDTLSRRNLDAKILSNQQSRYWTDLDNSMREVKELDKAPTMAT